MGLIGDAIAAVRSAMNSAAGVAITYARGASEVSVTAIPRRAVYEQYDEDGAVSRTQQRDYEIAAADLDFGAGAVLPEEGDTVEEGGDSYVVASNRGEPHWRWIDHGQTILRVHTKLKARA